MIGFEKFGKKRDLGIVPTEDARLLLIDPSSDGFFANILNYVAKYEHAETVPFIYFFHLKDYTKNLMRLQDAKIGKFWIPIYDPSIEGGEVVFKAGKAPAVGRSLNFWKKKAEEMPTVDGKHWSVGSKHQYNAFLVWLINSLVESGWNVEDAIKAVGYDSKKLGHYWNSNNALYDFEKTGSREVCGVYDLANTYKMLSGKYDGLYGGFMAAGGSFGCKSTAALGCIRFYYNTALENMYNDGVGWLVLS